MVRVAKNWIAVAIIMVWCLAGGWQAAGAAGSAANSVAQATPNSSQQGDGNSVEPPTASPAQPMDSGTQSNGPPYMSSTPASTPTSAPYDGNGNNPTSTAAPGVNAPNPDATASPGDGTSGNQSSNPPSARATARLWIGRIVVLLVLAAVIGAGVWQRQSIVDWVYKMAEEDSNFKPRAEPPARTPEAAIQSRRSAEAPSQESLDASQSAQPQILYRDVLERVYVEWGQALERSDVDALTALYAADAVIESPLVPRLLGQEQGICRGQENIRRFFHALAETKPSIQYRTPYLTDGGKIMWEYPRATPAGQQVDGVEVMEIREQLIQHHRVYLGWRTLQQDERRAPDAANSAR